MNVSIYSRVSTDDKDQNPERQLIQCRNYCRACAHEIIGEFQEHCTGDSSPFLRPIFSKLMETKPDAIIVSSIDRLTRQHPNKTMALLSQFKASGILIISVTEPLFNMESPMAEPLQYFLTWWNNYFLKKLKADVKAGIERARQQGKPIGRPKVPFNEFRAYHLLMEENKSLTLVSQELNVSRATLHRFKKVMEKNPELFKNKLGISKTDVIETIKC